MNKEGYKDLTADRAIYNASKLPRHIKEVIRVLNTVASLHSLEVTEVMDTKTRQRWRR